MKRTIALLAVLSLAGSASATTIAHWRFETGVSTGDHDNHYVDSSGNGNHLSAWTNTQNPVVASEVPFTSIQGGTTNEVALDFDGWANLDNIGTWEWDGTGTNDISVKMIDSLSFTNGWTIEGTFNSREWNWGNIVCKAGKPTDRFEPTLRTQVRADTHEFSFGFLSIDGGTTNWTQIDSIDPVHLDRWYSFAGTYDTNGTFSMYLRQEDGGDYALQGVTNVLNATLNLDTNFWKIGSGTADGNPVAEFFNGMIDEVRVSDGVLATNEFINQDGFRILFDLEDPYGLATDNFIAWDLPFDLSASDFWSPVGYAFTGSVWQISTISNDFSSPVWEETPGAVETVEVPASTLSAGNTYYARVQYQTDNGPTAWSDVAELDLVPVETVAHWSFNELGNGLRHDTDNDDFYQDGSGHGNHLSSKSQKYRPVYTDDVGCGIAATNAGSIKTGGFGSTYDSLVTGVITDTGDELNSYSFTNGWTIEIVLKIHALRDWMVPFQKDGRAWAHRAEQPFSFKVHPAGDYIHCFAARDDQTATVERFDWINTGSVVAGEWYALAATYDGAQFKLYMKSEGNTDYVLQGSLDRTEGFSLGAWDLPWVIGRGRWNDNKEALFNGLIDEVRISNGALPTSHFLGNIGTVGAYDVRPPEKVYLTEYAGVDSVIRLSGSEAFSPRGYVANSQWRVATDAGLANVVWDSGLIVGKNYVDIPPHSLSASPAYVGVRYQANGNWTDWFVAAPETPNTLAHWRFEEGVNGDPMTTAVDSTGNGNDLVWGTVSPPGWPAAVTPFATADVPYGVVPYNWDDNAIALQVEDNQDYLVTSGTAIESHVFTGGWTVEATFRTLEPLWWQGIVSRSGKRSNGGEPQMRLMQRADTVGIAVDGADSNNNEWWRVDAFAATTAHQWHSAVVTYDNKLVRLYVKYPGSSAYELQGCSNVPLGIDLAGSLREWRVGSALWDDQWNDALGGVLDEVRITEGAREPGCFIADEGAGWDSDGDGIADVWEIDNFGNITTADDTTDSDSDGVSDLDEFRNGGNPNDDLDLGYGSTTGSYDPGTGTNVFEFVVPRRKNPYSGNDCEIETTTDLVFVPFAPDASVTITGIESLGDGMEMITNVVPCDVDQKFLKLIVE